VIDEDRHARTRAALESLPARLGRILVLREVEWLAMGEAAKRLGLSRQAAERRWARAVVLMTERLGEVELGHATLSPLVPAKAGTQEPR